MEQEVFISIINHIFLWSYYPVQIDSGIFKKFSLYQHLQSHIFSPEESVLPGTNRVLAHVIVGDEVFQLTEHVLRLYPRNQANLETEKRIFNYHLCRARRTFENVFGILCQTFPIFLMPIATCPPVVADIITVSCCLHKIIATVINRLVVDL